MISVSDILRTVHSRDTGYRVHVMPNLGFSMDCSEQASSMTVQMPDVRIHSTELKLGVSYTIDSFSPKREQEYRTRQMVSQLHDHLYGEVKHRVHGIIRELKFQHIASDSSAMTMLDKLSRDLES